ncbi:hypothetical protein E2P81_ATG05039 [Venturia nashicola]|uniref:Uncharacterized protein n=1 Tax=Venturia nashicola TaxID=86259 RepID=A0A4Z1PA21_9PEZI|nr:hypothetical protein E6O75_ATG05166 [Venturia nashicola]TLD34874.1 hypothetical protein E2P81_ATG05039 [Venturia nashicola]
MSISRAERKASVLNRVLIILGLIVCTCSIIPGILYRLQREDLATCNAWDKNGITAAEIDNRLNRHLTMHDSLPWTDEKLFRINDRQCDDMFHEAFILITLIIFLLDLGGLLIIYALRGSIWSFVRTLFTGGTSIRRCVEPKSSMPFDSTAPFVVPSYEEPPNRHREDLEPMPFFQSLTFPGRSKRLSTIPEAKSRFGSSQDSSKDSGSATGQVNTGKSRKERFFEEIMKERKKIEDAGEWHFADHSKERQGQGRDSMLEDVQPPPKSKLQFYDEGLKANSEQAVAAFKAEDDNMKLQFASRAEEGRGKRKDSISEDMKPALMAMLQPNLPAASNQVKIDAASLNAERASQRMEFAPKEIAEEDVVW